MLDFMHFTHRDYFREFKLNVEQYGEILTAGAFHGLKLGDSQPGYDITTTRHVFENTLRTAGIITDQMLNHVTQDNIRIEVKSKLCEEAWVVDCKQTKIDGNGKKAVGMTHLAVILVHPGSRAKRDANRIQSNEGLITEAWLISLPRVVQMRNDTTREGKCLAVPEIRDFDGRDGSVVKITQLLRNIADTPLVQLLATARAEQVYPGC